MLDYGTQKLGRIGQFRFWCQKVLPAVYDDSLSYYELLCKVIAKLNEVVEIVNDEQDGWKAILEELDNLQQQIDDFKNGGFEEVLDAWAKDNIPEFIENAIDMVFFGLTLDGYFVAYVPDSWDDIQFDTIIDYSDENYGRLVLEYLVDGATQDVEQP